MRRNWTEAEDQFLRDNINVVDADRIANQLGRTKEAVYKRFLRLKLKLIRRPVSDIEEAKEMRDQGYRLREIAKRFNVSPSTVRNWILGIKTERKPKPPRQYHTCNRKERCRNPAQYNLEPEDYYAVSKGGKRGDCIACYKYEQSQKREKRAYKSPRRELDVEAVVNSGISQQWLCGRIGHETNRT